MRVLALTVALLTLLAAFSDAGRGPELSLRLTPRQAFAPVKVHAQLRVDRPDTVLNCPSLVWDWGDGSRSLHTPDCDPYERARDPSFYSRDHDYRRGREDPFEVTVSAVNAAGKVKHQDSAWLRVRPGLGQ